MPRKRQRAEEGAITADHHTTPEGPVTATVEPPANDVEQAFRDRGIVTADQLPAPEQNCSGQENAEAKHQPRPVRETFTSSLAGVHAGEDKRFIRPRAFVDFEDDKRATAEEKAELKEAGLTYDQRDKGYTGIATPETRQARDELARKFTDRRLKEKAEQGQAQER